jgi:hypothetical protein
VSRQSFLHLDNVARADLAGAREVQACVWQRFPGIA